MRYSNSFKKSRSKDFVYNYLNLCLTPKGLNVRTADKPVLVSVT
jgi:hypothetical protein